MTSTVSLEPRQQVPISQIPSSVLSLSLTPAETGAPVSDESLANLAKLKQEEARVHETQSAIKTYKTMHEEIVTKLDMARIGRVAVEIEHQKVLSALRKELPTIDQVIELMNDHQDLQYSGPYPEKLQNLFGLQDLLKAADLQIQNFERELAKIKVHLQKMGVELEADDSFRNPSNIDGFKKAFLALGDRNEMAHLLWLASGRPDLKTFRPEESIRSASAKQIYAMSLNYLAIKKLEQFYSTIQLMEKPEHRHLSVLRKEWDRMTGETDFDREVCMHAKKVLLNAIWLLRGMIGANGREIQPQDISYENTLQECDWALFEALRRLTKNHLSLFTGQQGREGISALLGTLRHICAHDGTLSPEVIRNACLNAEREAVRLLYSALGMGCAKNPKQDNVDAFFEFFARNRDDQYSEFFLRFLSAIDRFENSHHELDTNRAGSSSADEKKAN